MSKPSSAKKDRSSGKITTRDLRHWSLLEEFSKELARGASAGLQPAAKGGPRRLLSEDNYLCAFLFALLNPVIDSMRGLCGASQLERVQREVCARPISLGSFSEAQNVFGFQRLEKLYEQLAQREVRTQAGALAAAMRLVDSTVFRAVPRMQWAEWRHQHKTQRAVRLHLKFNVLEGEPAGARVTKARCCEREAFAGMIQEGEFYVGDRYYGRDYGLLQRLDEAGCGYVIRLCEHANFTLLEELPIGEEDRRAGVVSDQIVRLGARARWHCGPVRVVRLEKDTLEEPLILVSNRLEPQCLSAALLGEIYRQRWAIELFFRWLKCVLGRPGNWHWMAESSQGAAIQIYLTLIAALLLSRHLGKLPGKRVMEMLHFYFMGMASSEELAVFLERQIARKAT